MQKQSFLMPTRFSIHCFVSSTVSTTDFPNWSGKLFGISKNLYSVVNEVNLNQSQEILYIFSWNCQEVFSNFLAVPGRIELPSEDRQSSVINHYTKGPLPRCFILFGKLPFDIDPICWFLSQMHLGNFSFSYSIVNELFSLNHKKYNNQFSCDCQELFSFFGSPIRIWTKNTSSKEMCDNHFTIGLYKLVLLLWVEQRINPYKGSVMTI